MGTPCARASAARGDRGNAGGIRQNLHPRQSSSRLARARAPAVPDVGGEMVVVAARAIERRPRIMGGDGEAQVLGIERLSLWHIADLQVDMTDHARLPQWQGWLDRA